MEQELGIYSPEIYVALNSRLAEQDDVLQKGEISYMLSDMGSTKDKPFKISKTSKEIKTALKKLSSDIESQCGMMKAKMTVLKKNIGMEPTETISSYMMGRMSVDDRKEVLKMKMYSYDQRYPEDIIEVPVGASQMDRQVIRQNARLPRDVNDAMSQYNESVRRRIDFMVDKSMVDTLFRNLPDNKNIEMNIKQLNVLGF